MTAGIVSLVDGVCVLSSCDEDSCDGYGCDSCETGCDVGCDQACDNGCDLGCDNGCDYGGQGDPNPQFKVPAESACVNGSWNAINSIMLEKDQFLTPLRHQSAGERLDDSLLLLF